jgi:uncharacterized protein YraI
MGVATKRAAIGASFGLALLAAGAAEAATYGCFQVTGTAGLNIRATPFSSSAVVGTASKGEILKKWKRFCALRGFWCPVEKANGLRGHADKAFLKKVPCPNG